MLTTLLAGAVTGLIGSAPIDQHRIKSVAILPWAFRGGTPSAVLTAKATIDQFFDGAGYDRFSPNKVETVFHVSGMEVRGPEQDPLPRLPSDQEMKRIGRRLHADLVCAGEIDWHTRSIWVSLGPKTKATCLVNMRLVDMDNGGMALNEHDVEADDTAEESGFQTAAGLITGGLVTVVSGGPETPHQQRAAQIALSKAFEPWLEGVIGR